MGRGGSSAGRGGGGGGNSFGITKANVGERTEAAIQEYSSRFFISRALQGRNADISLLRQTASSDPGRIVEAARLETALGARADDLTGQGSAVPRLARGIRVLNDREYGGPSRTAREYLQRRVDRASARGNATQLERYQQALRNLRGR
jgi:hypothetical protein